MNGRELRGKKKNERKGVRRERWRERERNEKRSACFSIKELFYTPLVISLVLARHSSFFYPSSVLLYVLLTLEPLFLLLVRSLTGLNNLFFVEKVYIEGSQYNSRLLGITFQSSFAECNVIIKIHSLDMCTYISVSLPRIILVVRYSIAILLKIFVFATELYTSFERHSSLLFPLITEQ